MSRDVTARQLLELDRMYAHGAGGDGDGEVGDMAEAADVGAGSVRFG